MENKTVGMSDFMRFYENPDMHKINTNVINRERCDDDLINYLVDACKSLEVLENIKFMGYEFLDDESRININDYISSRSTAKKDKEKKYMYMHDNRCGQLKLRFYVECFDKKTNKMESREITKYILVPMADEDNYYTMKGKKFFLIYQLVDSSTYKTKDCVVLKSLLPVCMKREHFDLVDVDGEDFTVPIYKIMLFKKERDLLIFYLAKVGMTRTIAYFGLSGVVDLVNECVLNDDTYRYFQISSSLFIRVNRELFKKYKFIRSFIGMIKVITNIRTKQSVLESRHYWVERIGNSGAVKVDNAYERGRNSLTFMSRMLDETTKKILRINPEEKKNIFSIMRWMSQNFDELRTKDNLDLSNKRLRYNEFIAANFTLILSERLNRVIFKGNQMTIDHIVEIFNFPGTKLVSTLQNSGLLVFDDKVNDCDLITKLKFTKKGLQNLGHKNGKNVTKRYRALHPSHIGKLDISAYGNSDPGAGGSLTLGLETYGIDGTEGEGMYFSKENEAEETRYNIFKDMLDIQLRDVEEGEEVIFCGYTDKEDFEEKSAKLIDIYNKINFKSSSYRHIFNSEELNKVKNADKGRYKKTEEEVIKDIFSDYERRAQMDADYNFVSDDI